ncbi:probable mitochondrial adenine nucleotide transporter BTL3 [Nicotiana tomentosiformis]|uniref:Probable mitochondrial adenine nucleotide transporter BTL3 n=1 Tax=Nicotiana tabacum TaxID=4097 RepID=A0A1S3YKJ3_TOBAC|nr:probable mitochondrial adenine nucleotide transporter BTL3 [Nicotiana tomentosiformis]XP_016452759.1 PREDICTED: probable mitochondrial adenine nucleotide transporter BTL3 [Nicotiana tabacum]
MGNLEICLKDLIQSESKSNGVRCLSLRSSDLCLNSIGFDGNNNGGGLLLEDSSTSSFVSLISMENCSSSSECVLRARRRGIGINVRRDCGRFLSITLSDSNEILGQNGAEIEVGVCREVEKAEEKAKLHRGGALNTTKHLWSGAVAAMVSRTFVAPLERLKLEYIVRGEQKNLFELIKTIAVTQGIKGFWKGNFVNILRTAPFKAINFYSYEKYRDHLLKITGNEETTNIERFIAGAGAGITATVLCIPMDTIRTVMVAPGGEALGGLIGTCRHMIQTEGFFSLYKGLVPSIISMAPSGAVFYGVYDILKSAYLHSPEGRKRLENMKQQGEELNALDQLELGTVRTLVYGAIAGACAEAATYPFEVVRRQLQMQVRATKMSALATSLKIVEQGGIPALYAGLTPSLLQVLPSAAISYFVYEFMKIVLKVE